MLKIKFLFLSRALMPALIVSSLGFSAGGNAGIVLRFAAMQSETGEYGGDLNQSDGSVISAPSATLKDAGSYEFSLIAPARAPYHFYLRYQSLSADDYQQSANAQDIAVNLDKNSFDIGAFIPHTFLHHYNEAIIALRYDDVEHDIISRLSNAAVGLNSASYDQGLWGMHAANTMYFPMREKWQVSASVGVNLLMGNRDSRYTGTLNGDVDDSEFVIKTGLDTEVAIIFTASDRFRLTAGYSYSIMFDYLSQDLYTPKSLNDALLSAENSGDSHYREFGPFIALLLGF